MWQLTPTGVSDPYAHSTLSIAVLHALVHAVQQVGVSRDEFLRRGQIDPTLLEKDGRIARAQLFALLEIALDLTQDPAFGLRWTARRSERMFAPIKPLLAQCLTLAEALALLAHAYRLISDVSDYHIVVDGERVIVICRALPSESLRVQRLVAEMVMGGFCWLLRLYAPDAPIKVGFAHEAPRYKDAYPSVFGDTHRFAQPSTTLVFPEWALHKRALERDESTRDALATLVEQKLSRITQGVPYGERIREYLLREGWPKNTDMDSVAQALGCSVRTLRRRLAEEGRSYQDVLNDALAIVATSLLQKPSTIQEAAFAMGFTDANSFHRAFKRWTGITPTAFLRGRPAPGGGRSNQ
ncbi:MAG: AraC family transcriptional regulator ligand-binding domain-containing protein [Polyangiales bacterium]